ncbi:CoA pyrophosphatase [Thermanaerothrix sp. 4228-RoL]|uniref:CoA pyrophosphatase n=1 Tax=Thermanaerothrix solaris TaxID=3058434 RepID=A0ABU3NJX4_9CHLR|nr:CoA pyrophosphatase [Thermanaerothrix sp. 4228-RoL]MDT8897102.1 CoA pyrophosphatase [Thermanaerothrix sp. 4228-RoL]
MTRKKTNNPEAFIYVLNNLTDATIRERLSEFQARWIQSHVPTLFHRADLRPAAVLVPLLRKDNGWHLLFTKRTSRVQNHKGQVAFPGGAIEPGDPSVESAALRETWEEIGVDAYHITLLGQLPTLVSVTHYLIYPVVGKMAWPVTIHPSEEEVEKVFTIPLVWLAQSHHLEREMRPTPEGTLHEVLYFAPYRGEQVWGITARIVYLLLQALGIVPDDRTSEEKQNWMLV